MANREYIAAPQQQRIKPAFKLRKLDGKVSRKIFVKDAKTGKLVSKIVDEDAGYMLHCMNGSSIRIRNAEQLAELGITEVVPLVDGETGEVVGTVDL
jgi:hypothetical protein